MNSKQEGNYLGDLANTIVINTMMQVPFAQRDEKWRDEFLHHVAGANLKLGSPEVIMSQDDYPYLQLQTVNTEENFQAFVIQDQLQTLLEQGFGLAINADKGQADWVFSYGDLANLHLNGTFYSEKTLFTAPAAHVAIGKDEDILVGQPSEQILPAIVRDQLREFLTFSGVKFPKIMLIARNYTDEERASQDLVFNIMPTQFAREKDFQHIMNTIAWFLPKHYSFFGMDELSIENGFEAL